MRTLTFGATVSGAISARGAVDVYTFNATPGQLVYFDDLGGLSFAQLISAHVCWRNGWRRRRLATAMAMTEHGA